MLLCPQLLFARPLLTVANAPTILTLEAVAAVDVLLTRDQAVLAPNAMLGIQQLESIL
jgi:hypothetical protein